MRCTSKGCGEKIGWIGLVLCAIISLLAIGVRSVDARTTAHVTKVYDGDTVRLSDGRKVRYLGVNAPEYGQPFYGKAKRLNASLVLGQEVRLEFDGTKRDGLGRLLAYVYAGPIFVNGVLVEEGLAHAFFLQDHLQQADRLLEAQENARRGEIGIWAGNPSKSLLITRVVPGRKSKGSGMEFYVRIVNLSAEPVQLLGYVLMNEDARQYRFPEETVDPGETVLIVGGSYREGRGLHQVVLRWETEEAIWDPWEDTAFLLDPSEEVVDRFHYHRRRQWKD